MSPTKKPETPPTPPVPSPDTLHSIQNILTSNKGGIGLIVLLVAYLWSTAMMAGEYKAKIHTLETRLDALELKIDRIHEKMDNLRFLIESGKKAK